MPLKPSCLIVGAGDGVGSAIARAFAREGLAVCITRRPRNLDQLEAVAASIRSEGGEALLDEDAILKPDEIARNYVWLHNQQRSAWTFELDLRPWKETW